MLPFCYIVDEKNLHLIGKTELNCYSNKVVPITTYENVGSVSAISAKMAEMYEKSILMCLYNERCIGNENREKYIQELEEKLASTSKNITLLENETREFAKHKEAYYSFNYGRTFYAMLVQSLSELNAELDSVEKRAAEIPAEISANNDIIVESKGNAHKLNDCITKNIENAKCFDEYIEKYAAYLKNKQTLSNTEKVVNHNNARLNQIAEELTKTESGIEETSEKLRRIKNNLSEIRESSRSWMTPLWVKDYHSRSNSWSKNIAL